MNLEVNGSYIYFEIPIFGGIPITQTTVSFFLVTVLLCAACIKKKDTVVCRCWWKKV